MTFGFQDLRRLMLGFACVLAMLAALAAPGMAGDGQVVHVGETTSLRLDGTGWSLDRSASRQAQLVAVQGTKIAASSQTFSIRGLKPGQVTLVFRKGATTFRASIDVLR